MRMGWIGMRVGTGLAMAMLLLAGLACPRPAAAQVDMGKLSFEALTAPPSRPLISHAYAGEERGWSGHAAVRHVTVRHAGEHRAAAHWNRHVSRRVAAWHAGNRHVATRPAAARRGWSPRHVELRRASAVRHLGFVPAHPRRHRR